MKIVEYSERKHYAEIRSWWSNHAWPGIDPEMLPKNGFVVESGEQMICAGWLYSSDSAICWMEWIVGNPHISSQERGIGLDLLIQAIRDKARNLGFKIIFMSVQNERLIDRLVSNHGFRVSDETPVNLVGRV